MTLINTSFTYSNAWARSLDEAGSRPLRRTPTVGGAVCRGAGRRNRSLACSCHAQQKKLIAIDRRSGLIMLTTAPLLATANALPTSAAVVRTGGLDFKPRDLKFPPIFEGIWKVTSVLIKVDIPYGEATVPDIDVVRRAQAEDLNKKVEYSIKFIKDGNEDDENFVVLDRKYNTASMLAKYMPDLSMERAMERIQWTAPPASPDHMVVNLPGGLVVTSDITRRSQERTAPDALTTSEFYQQFIDDSYRVKLKATRAYTKWRWREESGLPQIIATQVIADYRDPADPSSASVPLQSIGQPVVLMTYRMTLQPLAAG